MRTIIQTARLKSSSFFGNRKDRAYFFLKFWGKSNVGRGLGRSNRVGLAGRDFCMRPMHVWVGYIEEWMGTFRPGSPLGGVAEKNSFSLGRQLGHYYPV